MERKEPDSLITKLLAKRDNIAAHVYDKLRFRMITQSEDEIVFVLRELVQRLVPFKLRDTRGITQRHRGPARFSGA